MQPPASARTSHNDTRFQYVGGNQSIDFVNTVSSMAHGPDRLIDYAALLEWTEGAGVTSQSATTSLRRRSDEYPARAVSVLAQGAQLRQLLEQLFSKLVQNEAAHTEITELNKRWLATSFAELALVPADKRTLHLAWPRAEEALEAPLWVIAHAAAMLLVSSDMSRIKRCGGEDCGWFFVDRSRNGLRRWCEMETCGTRMKSARRAAKTRSHQAATSLGGDMNR